MTPAAPGRRAAAAAFALLCVLLPALVAGAGIQDAPRPGELARLQLGIDPGSGTGPRSAVAELFYAVTAPTEATGTPEELLVAARLGSVVAMFGVAGLLYLLMATGRQRRTGLLACLALAGLPPVSIDGSALRPELPAALFGGLAVVLLAAYPVFVARRGRAVPAFACAVTTGLAIGLAAACVARAGVLLLVGGSALLLVGLAAMGSTVGVLRRRGLERVPQRAINRRLFPWIVLGVVQMVGTLWTVQACVDGDPMQLHPSSSSVGVLPSNALARVAVVVLAAAGGLRLLAAAGLRFARRRRVTPETIVLLYVGAMIAQATVSAPGSDGLLAAPALAILVAEGTTLLLQLAARGVRTA